MEDSPIQDGISGLIDEAKGKLSNPLVSAIGGAVVGAVVGGTVVGSIISHKKSSSKANKRKSGKTKHTKRGMKQDRSRRSKQKWEVAYQRRKRKLKRSLPGKRKGTHYTKNGQPYIILSSGKARFIKKNKR